MKTISKLLCIILGFVIGGVLGVIGLFVTTALLAQGVEDPSAFGWVWVLMFVTAPIGAFLGSIFGFMLHRRYIEPLI
ncbi:MAG: hypothetical protein GYB34_05975 [Gammaproteobacteria bacterium]|nr:hypothetical protein [Gammaproteobacteria bacterium]